MIYTFYSYKGGVGRSMALANVAEYFRRAGLRVVVVDWDLEAPGLEEFFWSDADRLDVVRAQVGVVDLLAEYIRLHPRMGFDLAVSALASEGEVAATRTATTAELLRRSLRPLHESLFPVHVDPESDSGRGAGLWLLTAGMRYGDSFPAYATAVQTFDWRQFYATYDGEAYFDWMREQLCAFADVVLIDSRTGVTEMGGVCARQLADVVVSLCAPNHQNLEGVVRMNDSFTREEVLRQRGERPLELLVVPTRLERSESALLAQFREEFASATERFLPEAFRRVGSSFLTLAIPYIPLYAFGERLAVGDPKADADLLAAYRRIALHLALLAGDSSPVNVALASELHREFRGLLPRVAVVGEHPDDPGGRGLRTRLAEARVGVWDDFPGLAQGGASLGSDGAADSAPIEHLVLLVGADREGWPRLRAEWLAARRLGVCTHAVLAPNVSPAVLPEWLATEPLLDPRDHAALLSRLSTPCRGIRTPLLAPPAAAQTVRREGAISALSRLLVEGAGSAGESTVVLTGPAGVGKTSLAQMACHEDRVVAAFPGGIYWSRGAGDEEAAAELDRMFTARTGRSAGTRDAGVLASRLRHAVGDAPYLLVIDEPASREAAAALPAPGDRGCRLIVSRDGQIAADRGARTFLLGPLAPAESLALLRAEAGVEPGDREEDEALGRLAADLLHLPPALRAAAAAVRSHLQAGRSVEAAASKVARALRTDSGGQGEVVAESLRTTIQSALESVTADDRNRLLQLASRSRGRAIPLASLRWRWGNTPEDRLESAQRLATAGLLVLDPATSRVAVPAAVRNTIRHAGTPARWTSAPKAAARWVSRYRNHAVTVVGLLFIAVGFLSTLAPKLQAPPLLTRGDSLAALNDADGSPRRRRELLSALYAGSRDFTGAELAGLDLSHQNLTGIDLTRANLAGARLVGTRLSEARLAGANLTDADLTGALLEGADLSGAKLVNAKLSGASLWNALVANVRLDSAATDARTILPNGTPGPFRLDEDASRGTLANGRPDMTNGGPTGVIWIGNHDGIRWEKPRLLTGNPSQPIDVPPSAIGPGQRYRVAGDMTLRARVPPNTAGYFREVEARGWVPANSAVTILAAPVQIDRRRVSGPEAKVQYWVMVRVDTAAPLVSVFYRDRGDADYAERVAEALRDRGYSRRLVAHRPGSGGDREASVRFFHTENATEAAEMARVLGQLLQDEGISGITVRREDRTSGGSGVARGQIEIWLPPLRRGR